MQPFRYPPLTTLCLYQPSPVLVDLTNIPSMPLSILILAIHSLLRTVYGVVIAVGGMAAHTKQVSAAFVTLIC